MNKIMKYSLFALAVALAFTAGDAFATTDVFGTALTRLTNTFKNVRAVIFVVGGFGLIGLGFAAIFGKVRWGWLAALATGLAIVAAAGAVVDYATQRNASLVPVENNLLSGDGTDKRSFGDTLIYGKGSALNNPTDSDGDAPSDSETGGGHGGFAG